MRIESGSGDRFVEDALVAKLGKTERCIVASTPFGLLGTSRARCEEEKPREGPPQVT